MTKQQLEERRAALTATLEKHLQAGVEFYLTDGIMIDETVEIEPGAVILPGTILRGQTRIGADSVIGPNSLLENVTVGRAVKFNASQGYNSVIDDGANIGPFVHIRPDSHICKNVHIGDFVEVKNSTVGEGTSVSHLTYVGDSDVGKYCNFGCGVVTVNYDGAAKHRNTIGDYAFIGCNTNLVAPVTVGDGAYTAAGSTITEDVPAGALGIARARQQNKLGWAKQKLEKFIEKQKKKQQK
ncbi:UDP-N-acetylglucosamine diphosphorylase [uncultured Ruthenibacterium sp.]|uniref:UDP-N-acetylglucosamine diphosphorylase n=1 Tax=uncultured Ruthenibacterium sp. TaxID=1905347 RepID=UPI00349E5C71